MQASLRLKMGQEVRHRPDTMAFLGVSRLAIGAINGLLCLLVPRRVFECLLDKPGDGFL
jgi:hypothetical protein